MKPKKRYKRGYPVAVLLGLEDNKAALWKIFSNVAKQQTTIHINGTRNSPTDLYNFHESIIYALRPTLKEGVRSIILAAPTRTSHNQEFLNHVYEHHKWLIQGKSKAAFSKITGSASTPSQVATLTRSSSFKQIISATNKEEAENLIEILEKRLNVSDKNNLVLFSLGEAENLILKRRKQGSPEPDYLLLTDRYLAENHAKSRLQRLIQIGANRNVKTRIIDAESSAGKRLTQLGGLVCLAQLG